MDNGTQGQATPPATGTPKKKPGFFGKLAALWKNGIKGKAICIVSALVILGIIGSCGDDEESGGGGSDWKYTGEYFDRVFNSVLNSFPKDEGVIYQHFPRDSFYCKVLAPIKVMQSTKKGNLVEIENSDRLIWVETQRRYEDGEPLDEGYYIRRGSYEYETALGAEKRVPRYIEVTDKKMLKKIEKAKQKLQAEEEAKEAQRIAAQEAWDAQRKAEEEARVAQRRAEEEAKKKELEEDAEQGAYELDIPIKSLCGFKLGVPPSQVQPLLQNDDGTPVQDFVANLHDHLAEYGRCQGTFRLAKPFRLFTHAVVQFRYGVGWHLNRVMLMADIANVSKESSTKEMTTVVELIEKKFGIKFEKGGGYSWGNKDGCYIQIGTRSDKLFLEYAAESLIAKLDDAAKMAREEAGKKTIDLDANAGADDL